jgi:hypothetical protein
LYHFAGAVGRYRSSAPASESPVSGEFLVISHIRDNHHKTQALLTPITVAPEYTSSQPLRWLSSSVLYSIIAREIN